MATFFALLPLYIFGNVHCFGMCGPLVMLIGAHRYRHFYFLGRTLSFTLAGFLAGALGAVLHSFLKLYHLAELLSLLLGLFIVIAGFNILFNLHFFYWTSHFSVFKFAANKLSLLLLKDRPTATFLFGFFTVFLPCGQTLIVFSACALSQSPWTGIFNGVMFALFTTPSLLFAMHTFHLFKSLKNYYQPILGCSSIIVGLLSICRGLAEMGWISHLRWTFPSSLYHIVIY